MLFSMDRLWDNFGMCLQKTGCFSHDTISGNNSDDLTIGSEWLLVEEPTGYFLPKMQKKKQLLQLDQVRHVLHYGNYRRVIQMQNISLVTPVEETDTNGMQRWWMTIQDPSTLQVWVVHFPSLDRLLVWIDLLRTILNITKSYAVVADMIVANKREIASTIVNAKETILEMTPEE